MRLLNKKIVVIGGGRGIGKAIVTAMAQEGAVIALTYLNNSKNAYDTVNEINATGGKSKAFSLDLSEPSAFESFANEALSFLGNIDVLVNNAGVLTRNSFFEVTFDEYDKVLDTNLKGPYFLSQLIAKQMRDYGKGGSIINISSLSDRIATLGLTHYECSKAALSMLTKGLALELAPYHIRVNAVAPGLVATDINRAHWEKPTDLWLKRESEIPLKCAGQPKDVAGISVFLASDESVWTTGSIFTIDGGRSIY